MIKQSKVFIAAVQAEDNKVGNVYVMADSFDEALTVLKGTKVEGLQPAGPIFYDDHIDSDNKLTGETKKSKFDND